jgi:2-iminobutanoate/2-iminopropanoate deaminase
MRTTVDRPGGGSALPFSSGVIASGRLLFVAGQGPVDHASGEFVLGSFEEQVRLTLDNLAAVAAAGGGELSRAVKVNAYLRDMADFAAFNAIYREYFPGDPPARTTVQSDLPGFEVEIDAVIALDD